MANRDAPGGPRKRNRLPGKPGRPEGSMSRLAKESREKALETGALPHELLLQWSRGEPMARRVMGANSKKDDPSTWVWQYDPVETEVMRDSAKAAAPYYAPKISTVEVISGVSDDDLDSLIARAAAEAGFSLAASGEDDQDAQARDPRATD